MPALNLSYNSGGGNGIFGLGWSLSLPSIKRKTDKELPQYNDYIDSDTYLLSEAEDLVPQYKRNSDGSFVMSGTDYVIDENTSVSDFVIRYYRPRIEGLFARIERWTEISTGTIKWRVISKDNVTTLYGWSAASRLVNPAKASQIYEWLPELVFDDKGNCAHYLYSPEDDEGFDPTKTHNRNRYKNGNITYTNLYLNKVLYGNKVPYQFGDGFLLQRKYMFETVLDYGQFEPYSPYDLNGTWQFRDDAFSEYKAGFEIRTTRLCQRVLLFHRFAELDASELPVLIKSLNFSYTSNGQQGFSFLHSVRQFGYIKLSDGNYSRKGLPRLKFTYQSHQWNKEVKSISPENLANAPVGLNEPYQFTDLFNEGLSGILSEQGGAWYYKRNNGGGNFEAAQQVSPKPSFSGLGGALQLLDLDGDGVKQLVNFNSSPQGYYELKTLPEESEQWQRFKSFHQLPNINLNDSNARLLDLNGDGKTDLLITEESVFRWYESDGRNGYKDYHTSPKFLDEEDGPRLVFADSTQSIHLADMSGDGLVDIVRVRNGEICYWPNLGYGNFGTKVTMDNSPVFDNDADFNPAYLKISDIDGSGTPDFIYLGKNKFSCWMNYGGNEFATTPFELDGFPAIHNKASVTVTDLLGTGLSCIVWSSPLQKDTQSPLYYVDLMNSIKPHILIKHSNSLGKEVELEYTPSTKYYIDDKLAGTPWLTRLHFPVYCVSKVTSKDKVTGHTFVSNYTYHHGYFDHAEKEFRGFGRVDQTDTEDFEHWKKGDLISGTNYDLDDDTLQQAPVLTRSWFHTGAGVVSRATGLSALGSNKPGILDLFANEYWDQEMLRKGFTFSSVETPLPEAKVVADIPGVNAALANNLNPIEKREALRACKSMALRSEVFALEGSAEDQLKPYSVGTHNCVIELIQPKGQNKHAVFCVKESEAVTYSYERNLADPRIAHKFNLELDQYGNVLKSASVVYPRLVPDTSLSEPTKSIQAKTLITYTENTFTNDATGTNFYRLRLPCETKTYEVTCLPKMGTTHSSPKVHLYRLEDFNNLALEDEIPYEEDTPSASDINIRMIEHVFSLYYENDLGAALPKGELDFLAIPYENYQRAYTEDPAGSDMLDAIFNTGTTRVTGADMIAGQFENIDDNWWVRSGVVEYITAPETDTAAKARFYTPVAYTNQWGSKTIVEYDSDYSLFIKRTEDAVGNENSVLTFDYRNLSPVKMRDANDNESEVLLDELGLPKAMALYGKGSEGDSLSALATETDLTEQALIDNYFAAARAAITNSDDLKLKAADLLQQATARFVYDFNVQPAVVSTIMREEHYAVDASNTKTQISFEYSDGFNRVVMKKVQAEGGDALQTTVNNGSITISPVNTNELSTAVLRWIGNGRTVLNNKGNAVKKYEPYFSVTAAYENHKELVEQGVTPVLHYDALGRLIKTDYPNGSYSKVEFDSWKQKNYDQNDTCDSTTTVTNSWYYRMKNDFGAEEADAADKAADHYDTPSTLHFDTLGRPVLLQEMLDNSTIYETLSIIDIEGNLREVHDARYASTGKALMKYKYDMLGQMVYQESADSGKRWLLHDCMGAPLRTWDERDHEIQFDYDVLHRPYTVTLIENWNTLNPIAKVVEKYIYGDDPSLNNPEQNNLKGHLYRHCDTGGLEQMAAYDFKGHALSTERWLAKDYKNVVDWTTVPTFPLSGTSPLETVSYTISTTYDALGRIKTQTAPDGSIITPGYSERGVLNNENVNHVSMGNQNPLSNIEYDAKGQRSKVEYGNGTYTSYTYDAKTFRLKRLLTKDNGNKVLQDQAYWYDAVGNITWKRDDCEPDTFYNNSMVRAENKYEYDALYRLTIATGRENDAAVSFTSSDNHDDSPFKLQLSLTDPMALQNYTQEYSYDAVGNITKLKHIANQGSYTRDYTYNSTNNRLSYTKIGSTQYDYSYHTEHGFITEMPHLPLMLWNWKEEVCATSRQVVSGGDIPETTYYQYDGKGKRLRKITENFATFGNTPTVKQSTTYIEGYEYFEDQSGQQSHTLSLIDEGRRFVMFETSTSPDYSLIRYQHPNHQGSCTLETDDKGDIITYEEYHPFGTTSYQATNASITAAAKRYRYTGMERDEETGLSYHNARYYIPWLGRWLNPDPIGIGDGVNVYAYCGNNPVTYTDTSGTQFNKPFVAKQDNTKVVPGIDFKGLIQAGQKQAKAETQAKEGAKLAKAFGDTYKANNPGFAEHAKEVQSKQQKKSETATRVEGALQVVGGAVEAAVGGVGGVVTSETGIGAAAGWAVLTHGADNMATGFNKLMTGQPSQTFTEKGISAVAQDYGASKATADKIGAFGNAALGIAGSGNLVARVDALGVKAPPTAIVNNPIPTTLVRVVPANIESATLGAPGATDVFVTAADDIAGLSSKEIAQKLTIPESSSGFKLIEFPTPAEGLSSPINRSNPGFVGFGKTAGGAREFTIPNQLIPNEASIKIIP